MARILIVEDTKGFPKKHINHAKARMEVWKKGYGLYCDVNGKLYVYCKGKPSNKKGEVKG
jgi:hypothetical protein